MNLPTDLITPSQAARLVDVHVSAVFRWIKSGNLPAWRKGGCRYWVSKADVERMMQPVRVPPPQPPWAWRA
jgi:excisionase family DNA binding protein